MSLKLSTSFSKPLIKAGPRSRTTSALIQNRSRTRRTRLAHACLIVARDDSDDPERIKMDALQVMALAYRERNDFGVGPLGSVTD